MAPGMLLPCHVSDFNSIKVRLELPSILNTEQSYYFNSIKVRLELIGSLTASHGLKFQFHKGAIRTRRKERKGQSNVYFNSIKVRLELKDTTTLYRLS